MVVDCAIALVAALTAGHFTSEAAYLAGFGVVSVSVFSRAWRRLGLLFLCVVAVMSHMHVIDSMLLRATTLASLYLVTCTLSTSEQSKNAVAFGVVVLACVAFACRLLQNEFYGDCLLCAAIATVPVPAIDISGIRSRTVLFCGLGLAVAGAFLVAFTNGEGKKCAMLEHGVWAKADRVLEKAPVVDQKTLYSYAELKRLLNAECLTATDDLQRFGELWIITPTQRFSAKEVNDVISWVFCGGRLIVVTDHTDFLGHARCANQLLERAGIRVSDTALFPEPEGTPVAVPFGRGISLLTPNAVTGIGVLPVMVASYIEEKPDYSGRNFFGPLSHSLDDRMRCRCVVGEKPYGAGSICVVSDSTMFANFAVYLPDSQDLLRVVRTHHGARVVAYLMPAVIAVMLLATRVAVTWLVVAISVGCILAVLWRGPAPALHWDRPLLWSGDRTMISHAADPDVSLSTAYAMFPVSGKQPRWTDAASASETGVWIGMQPPPKPGWKWLVTDLNRGPVEEDTSAVLETINPRPPISVAVDLPPAHVSYGRLWSNSAFGDWWVDAGISKAKRERLDRFLAWCLGQNITATAIGSVKEPLIDCELIVAGQVRAVGQVQNVFAGEGEVYLGRGVSGHIEFVDGEKVIVGTPSLVEGWGVPASWVIRRKPTE